MFQRLEELGRLWWTRRELRLLAKTLALAGGGSLLSAAGLRGYPMPLIMGPVLGTGGYESLALCAGSLLGYRFFWPGSSGAWWVLGAGVLALLALPEKVLPMLGVLAVGLTALILGEKRPLPVYLLELTAAGGSILIFRSRSRNGRWLQCAVGTLALAQVAPLPWLGLGYGLAGALTCGASFPAAALGGLGLDLAGITGVPMSAAMTVGWLGRFLPGSRSLRWLLPGAGAVAVMFALDRWDWRVLPGLLAGGACGLLLPSFPPAALRRDTGPAQVRLELAAEALCAMGQAVGARDPAPVDREALLQTVRNRACGSCPSRGTCLEQERLTATVLEDSHPFPCRRPDRLRRSLTCARERLRLMNAERRRREEYRTALADQYRSTGAMLRRLADGLPRKEPARRRYGVTVAVRTRGKQEVSGDRWAAFPGDGAVYYILLCDGMGTGPGAGAEGKSAVALLRSLLTAGATPSEALGSLNAMLTLGDRPGAVAVDLVRLRLDTGTATLFKWGAAPSWRVAAGKGIKLGPGTPPPGFAVGAAREWRGRISLREGMLLMVSDGVDPEKIPRTLALARDASPGELADRLLEGQTHDDATAAVIRLYLLT